MHWNGGSGREGSLMDGAGLQEARRAWDLAPVWVPPASTGPETHALQSTASQGSDGLTQALLAAWARLSEAEPAGRGLEVSGSQGACARRGTWLWWQQWPPGRPGQETSRETLCGSQPPARGRSCRAAEKGRPTRLHPRPRVSGRGVRDTALLGRKGLVTGLSTSCVTSAISHLHACPLPACPNPGPHSPCDAAEGPGTTPPLLHGVQRQPG